LYPLLVHSFNAGYINPLQSRKFNSSSSISAWITLRKLCKKSYNFFVCGVVAKAQSGD
jgi:hypothetical protein